MRAFYTDRSGRTADICQMHLRKETRVRVRDISERVVVETMCDTWDAAIDTLKSLGNHWTNDITGNPLA